MATRKPRVLGLYDALTFGRHKGCTPQELLRNSNQNYYLQYLAYLWKNGAIEPVGGLRAALEDWRDENKGAWEKIKVTKKESVQEEAKAILESKSTTVQFIGLQPERCAMWGSW